MTYKEYHQKEREHFTGLRITYKGEPHTIVDVDYNGALLIDLPTQYTSTTAIGKFDPDLTFTDNKDHSAKAILKEVTG